MNRSWGLLILLGVLGLAYLVSRKTTGQCVTNAETWEWTDWQGNQRRAVVHRRVEQS